MGYGDELMVTGRARTMQRTDPRRVLVTFQGVPRWGQYAAVWENNPRFARPNEAGDFQELQARDKKTNMRPYHLAKTDKQWTYNLDFRPEVGELYFTDAERAFGGQYPGRIIVEPHVKPGASPNKQWGWARWQAVADLLRKDGIRVTQLGPAGTKLLDGAELVPTPSFRMACAVLAGARACVLSEGGAHHAAAALGIPGVVIFGGYIAVETTGYPGHRNLGVHVGEACGMRTPCKHCAAVMASIAPEGVAESMTEILEGVTA